MGQQAERINGLFRQAYGSQPQRIVRSPGRVNVIGEHTDYNDGFVLPAAVDKAVWFAVSPRNDRRARLLAADLEQSAELDLDCLQRSPLHWPDYLAGIVSVLEADGRPVRGFDAVFGGDLPRASGMSSSAALECGLIVALNDLFDLGLDRRAMALLAQAAENRFVGVRCGIMDQFANLFGKQGHLLHIDCRSLDHAAIPFSRSDLRLVLCDTRVRRKLAGSEYNVRRSQCEAGVASLRLRNPSLRSLRDVTSELLLSGRAEMEPLIYRRCLYVVEENQRVTDACDALKRNDFAALGRLMSASHAGLRDLYEVSCPELDLLAETAATVPGVLGSRMMGAGFGGCTINLIESGALDIFRGKIADAYARKFGQSPDIHACRVEAGTTVVV